MYNTNSSPVLINAAISGNTAVTGSGGGMRSDLSSPVLINTTVSGNTAATQGGGMYGSSLALINVLISGNTADSGGGIHNTGSPSPTLINVTIAGNTVATQGGGIYNAGSNLVITNSIIWGNTASGGGPSISNLGVTPTMTFSIVEGDPSGTGNQTAPSPVDAAHSPFTDWKDPGYAPTTEGDYRLNNTGNAAAAKNNGLNGNYPTSADDTSVFPASLSTTVKAAIDAALGKDLAGNTRKQGPAIDMGAYEKE
jgi:predicted outer membrane repeat protein